MNLLFGQSHPVINQFVFKTLSQHTFIDQDFISPQHERAVIDLAALLPAHLTVFNLRMNDGSSAVECAVKQARCATGRSLVLTIDGIYLGQNSQVIHFRGWGKRPEDLLIGSTEDVIFAPMPYPDYSISIEEAHNENGKADIPTWLIKIAVSTHHKVIGKVLKINLKSVIISMQLSLSFN